MSIYLMIHARSCTFIVLRNKLQNAINYYMIDIHLKMLKQKCYIIVATNTNKKGLICKDIKYVVQ